MQFFKRVPLWVLSGVLYGLSWPIFEKINLSFLGWFAFVPLFIFLERNQHHFWKWILGSYAAMIIFGTFSAGWLFNFPQATLQIALIFFLEELWFFIPFLLWYLIKEKIGFNKSLWLFPILWMVWEWFYLDLEFTMGTHLSAYSQSNNLWLIQFIDLTGMWGISFWLMLFNVLIFKTYQKNNYRLNTKPFIKKTVLISTIMLGFPLCYAGYAFATYSKENDKTILIAVIPTKFTPRFLLSPDHQYSVVEQTLYKTDQFAFKMKEQQIFPDLYVWPETGLPFTLEQTNLSELLFNATKDWKAALLTGGRGIIDTTTVKDYRTYVSGVLISHKRNSPNLHHKTVLSPGQETVPYHRYLAKIPNFPIAITDPRFYKKGNVSKPLPLTTKDNSNFLVGVSLCYEQWFPKHWAALARNGAEFYTHLAGEGWYGNIGFMTFMANVTRMRVIENRKPVARVANVGVSGFIDELGYFTKTKNSQTLTPISKKINASKTISFYAKYPNWFPLLSLGIFSAYFIFQIYLINNKRFKNKLL